MSQEDVAYNEPARLDDAASDVSESRSKMPSIGELYMYCVALCCGISLMMPINAVFSAPSYIMFYYRYAMKDPDAEAHHTNFWSNCLTYYNLISLVTCLVSEPITLTQTFRRIPMLPRLLAGLLILIGEIILIMIVPAVGTTEVGAIITICFCGLIGGTGKSIFESTVYGMLGAFPPTFTSTMMGGVGASGVITSVIQVIVRGALGQGYKNEEKQAKIYYGLDVGIQGLTFVMLLLLRFNSFARNHFGDLGGTKSRVDAGDLKIDTHKVRRQPSGEEAAEEMATGGAADVSKGATDNADCAPEGSVAEGSPTSVGSASEVSGPTSNEVLMATGILSTLSKCKWMCISCGFNFFITLMLFPTIVISADPVDYWFATVAILVFNILDVVGRFCPTFKITWPPAHRQMCIVIVSFARIIFLPLLLLYSYHYIPSHAFGYVMMVLFGFSNGYVGTMSLVLGPKSRGINNDGQRFVAATLVGISILIGGTAGSVLAIGIQTARGS